MLITNCHFKKGGTGMNKKIFENSDENEAFFKFMEVLWNIATDYAQSKPPVFACTTDKGKHLLLIPYLIWYKTDKEKQALAISYINFDKAKYDIDTNIIQSNKGSEVKISITVSRNARNECYVPLLDGFTSKDTGNLLLNQFAEAMVYYYDVVDEMPHQHIFSGKIGETDLHMFFEFSVLFKEHKIIEVNQLELEWSEDVEE